MLHTFRHDEILAGFSEPQRDRHKAKTFQGIPTLTEKIIVAVQWKPITTGIM